MKKRTKDRRRKTISRRVDPRRLLKWPKRKKR